MMKPRADLLDFGQHATDKATIRLRILETTDLHGHAHGYDYFKDSPCSMTGFSRVATLIEAARTECPNVLLFDNGDALQGTPMTQFWGEKRKIGTNECHPMIQAFNLAGYDAATVGNHDFDYGIGFLQRAASGANYPIVSANALQRKHDGSITPILPPWAVLEREFTDTTGYSHRLRIGIIGLLPPQTELWVQSATDSRFLGQPIVEAARAHLPALLAQKPDLVIALAHTGIAPLTQAQRTAPDLEQAALALAEIDGIDVLLCGHTHLPFPSPGNQEFPGIDTTGGALNGKPALNAGRWGSHLGVIDLRLTRDPRRGWIPDGFKTELRPIRQSCPDSGRVTILPEAPGILSALQPAHTETLQHVRQPLGRLTARVHSYFSLINTDPILTFLASAQRQFAKRRLIGKPEESLPIISAVAPFKSGGRGGAGYYIDIQPGPIVMANVQDIYLYTNTISALEVTGADLANWLERSAGAFNTLSPERPDTPLRCPDLPSYNFDILDGLTYSFDLRGPRKFAPDGRLETPGAARVRDLRHNGVPVHPDQRFTLITNSYRASGAGGFVSGSMRPISLGPQAMVREVLIEHVSHYPTVTPVPKPVWRFAPMPGCSATFDTSPMADSCLHEIAKYRPEFLEQNGSGFMRLRLFFGQDVANAAAPIPEPGCYPTPAMPCPGSA